MAFLHYRIPLLILVALSLFSDLAKPAAGDWSHWRGPDLNGIRTRHDVNYVIRSILIPDEYIVEGFQQTSLAMKDGRKLFGMIQEETAEMVKIYLPTGEQVIIKAADILKRDDARNSGMPSSFTYTLNERDVADLAAWIMTLE